MPRTLLVSFSALTTLFLLSSSAPGQAPAPLPPPTPLVSPPPAVTYFSGPGVVYFGSPKYSFRAGTDLPATVYPPGYGYMGGYGYTGGMVGTSVGLGIFRPRGVRTYYRPGYMVSAYPPAPPGTLVP